MVHTEDDDTVPEANCDVADEKEFEKLIVEMDENKDKMKELENKATLLQNKLENKAHLLQNKLDTQQPILGRFSGVKVVALEYKTVILQVGKVHDEKTASIEDKPNLFEMLLPRPPPPRKESRDILDAIYQEFEEVTMKKLGQEGWSLQAVHSRGGTIIHYYFSRPL